MTGGERWMQQVSAALSEGFCPSACGRIVPLASTAHIAGYCPVCGYHWWTGGPEKEWAHTGMTMTPDNVPGLAASCVRQVGA